MNVTDVVEQIKIVLPQAVEQGAAEQLASSLLTFSAKLAQIYTSLGQSSQMLHRFVSSGCPPVIRKHEFLPGDSYFTTLQLSQKLLRQHQP